jgi:hypothetical protein
MFVANVKEDRSPWIPEFLVNKRRQMVIAGKLKPGSIERASWRQPRIHDHDDIVCFCNEASVSQVGDVHCRAPALDAYEFHLL